jgi:hypothetical protein
MSEETTNPGETPANQGGGTTPQTDSQPTEDVVVAGETPANQGGGTVQ